MKKFQRFLFVCSTVFASGYCSLVSSHELSGSLGDPFYSTDVYNVQCSTDSGGVSDFLETSITDITKTSGGGKVSAVIQAGGVVTQTSDPIRDDGISSPEQSVHAGNGIYEIFVHKLKAGAKVYTLDYHCKSSTGAHTGTSVITVQNQ